MAFKFEGLEIWNLALEYADLNYEITTQLPRDEDFNLKSQRRAIDPEQKWMRESNTDYSVTDYSVDDRDD